MDNFLTTHPLLEENTTSTVIEDPRVPAELNSVLQQANSNSYANGFFKFVLAKHFQHYCALWNLKSEDCFPFLKVAFGHLIFFHEGQYKAINPLFNDIDVLGQKDDLDFVMNILLCDRPGLEGSFLIDIYEQAFVKLGPPKLDEIFAFVPALGLGGSRNADYVQKLQMEREMLILSQI